MCFDFFQKPDEEHHILYSSVNAKSQDQRISILVTNMKLAWKSCFQPISGSVISKVIYEGRFLESDQWMFDAHFIPTLTAQLLLVCCWLFSLSDRTQTIVLLRRIWFTTTSIYTSDSSNLKMVYHFHNLFYFCENLYSLNCTDQAMFMKNNHNEE